MQTAKKAVETVKETAANIGASAKSGLEKTKATIQEKTEKMSAHDQMQKDMATQKKEERINQAEKEKQLARENNAAAKQSVGAGHMQQGHYTTSEPGQETATDITTGPGHETTTHNTTGPITETFTCPNTGEYGQPTGANHMSAMHGHEHGGIFVGSHDTGTNTFVDTTAHNNDVCGTAPASGPNFS